MRGPRAVRTPAVGDVFGRWTVVAIPAVQRLAKDRWLCRCVCKVEKALLGKRLLEGRTKSCGCYSRDLLAERGSIRRTKLSWEKMIKAPGALVDAVWCESFEAFVTSMGEQPHGAVLSRRDLQGTFDLSNCFWEMRSCLRARLKEIRCARLGSQKPLSDVATAKYLLTHARSRAYAKSLEFTLALKDLLPLPTHCPVLGIRLERGSRLQQASSMSLDRKDNTAGYVPGNVAVISHLANRLKSDATADQLSHIVTWMRERPVQNTDGVSEGFLL